MRKRIFILKIDLPAMLAIAFFAGLIFFYLIPGFEKVMMDRKRNLIHEITSSAYSLLEHYHSMETTGILDTREAQEQAKAAISTIRYGENLKDYFWITDMHPRMVVHPYRPDLNGTDLTGFRDTNGKTIFVEFVNAVSVSGESYVDYMWQWNDDSTRNVPKLSYVKLFKPWGWIIGTGIYIEDVRSEIHRMELSALIISGVIGIVIIILLIVISGQSHKIEQKRNKAEDELQKSRELYRTLAEAASEGVLIWSDLGLQANKILLSWLDYTEEELRCIPLKEVFSSAEIDEYNDSDSLYEELNSGRYFDTFLRVRNGNLIKAHADFSRILMGEMKAVLVVIRPGIAMTVTPGFSTNADLLNDIGTGFFRITYGRKSRFIFASKPVIEILGFDNLQDLLPNSFESFISDPLQLKIFRSSLLSKEQVYCREILLKQKEGGEIWVLLNLLFVESGSDEVWFEGTIERLSASSAQNNLINADLNSFSATYILANSVSSIMSPPVSCPENLSVKDALAIIKEKETQYIIVLNKYEEPVGVADAVKICFRLADGGSSDTEIFRWMDSPPDFIAKDATIDEAYGILGRGTKKCLLATNNKNELTGIISSSDLSKAFSYSSGLLSCEIDDAGSPSDLQNIFLKSRKIASSMILGNADPYSISLFISSIADAICSKIILLCLEETGNPPCRFAFIQTGSAGRREQSLSTDQDNAIIFENCEGEKYQAASAYFVSLGEKINDMLSKVGFRLCKGGNMAGNPRWCQPLSTWKKYFSDWINTPGPEELLDVSIFFDFRFCYGDNTLSDKLGEYVKKDLNTSDIFFHHMATTWKQFHPSLANTQDGKTDIKRILMPLTGIIRLYSLKYGIDGYSSIERIIELYSGKYIDERILRDTIAAWKDLTSIRLKHQLSCINNGTEPDNIIDLHLLYNNLKYFADQSVEAVKNLMLKAGNDFYA